METLNLFIKSIFIDNMVFAFFFGMCSYIAVSKNVKTALGLGLAVTFVQTMTVPLNYLLNEYVLAPNALVEGVDLSFLSFIIFIALKGDATVVADGNHIQLTYKEFELLCMFLSHPGMVFTREQLYTQVWQMDYIGDSRTLDTHIRTLRSKIDDYGKMIETVRGVGYRWVVL